MVKQKVLIPTHPLRNQLPKTLPEFKEFEEQFEVLIEKFEDAEEFKKALQTKYNDVSAIWANIPFVRGIGGFNQFIEFLPSSVKVVGYASVGANLFDTEALRAKGVNLVNIGNASAKNVADIALSLVLSTFRYTHFWERATREADGDFQKAKKAIGSLDYDESTGKVIERENDDNLTEKLLIAGNQLESPSGKVAGLVGFGSIGKEIARRLDVIGLDIYYTKTKPLTEKELSELSFKPKYYSSFEELIPHVDVIVLAVPHTANTINLINEDTLKLVKKGVRIVNIGRGTAIDEDALFKALDDHTVNSIGLDVAQNEPIVDKRFFNRPNVTILPHVGAFTVNNFQDAAKRVIKNITSVLEGKPEDADVIN